MAAVGLPEPKAAPAATRSFHDDFIVVSEFSEQLGPVPLLIEPPDNVGTFDVGNFVVRTLAVDFQRNSDPCNVPEDTQVVFRIPSEEANAYVHHFSLYDIHARGYVRPICISYVTHDHHKIMDNFAVFHEEFSKVTTLLKTANQLVFMRDLQRRVADLQLTKEAVLHELATDVDGIKRRGSGVTEESVQRYVTELQDMEQRLRMNLIDKIRNSRRLREFFDDPQLLTAAEQDGTAYAPQVLQTIHKVTEFDRGLRPLRILCDLGYKPAEIRLQRLQRRFSRLSMMLTLDREDGPRLRTRPTVLHVGGQALVNFDFDLDSYRKAARACYPRRMMHRQRWRRGSISSVSSRAPSLLTEDEAHDDDAESCASYSSHSTFEDAQSCFDDSRAGAVTAPAPPYSLNADCEDNDDDEVASAGRSGEGAEAPPRLPERKPADIPLLTFARHYHWARHLVFALLSGRPVVIHAQTRNKESVKQLVSTLSVLLPGPVAGRCVLWRRRALQLADLGALRLCGLRRESVIAPNVARHVSVFDFELEELKTPPYTGGTIVDDILSDKKRWPDEATFLAHVRLVLLRAGLKACILYYMCGVGLVPCCLAKAADSASWLPTALSASTGGPRSLQRSGELPMHASHNSIKASLSSVPHLDDGASVTTASDDMLASTTTSGISPYRRRANSTTRASHRRMRANTLDGDVRAALLRAQDAAAAAAAAQDATREPDKSIFRQLNVGGSDMEIIANFADIIKMQQLRDMQERHGAPPPPTIRLDSHPLETFRNRAPR